MGRNYKQHHANILAKQKEWQATPGKCHHCGEPVKFSPNHCPRCLWTYRQSNRRRFGYDREYNGSSATDETLKREVRLQKLRLARKRLPEIKRLAEQRAEVWRLYYHRGMSMQAIGKRVGCAWPQVRKKIMQADEILTRYYPAVPNRQHLT